MAVVRAEEEEEREVPELMLYRGEVAGRRILEALVEMVFS